MCKREFYVSPSRLNKRKYCSLICKSKSQIGKEAWNKGKKRTWESNSFVKGHIPWNKGKSIGIMSYSTRKKISDALKGDKSYLWRGGITPLDKKERIRFKNEKQKEIFERDGYTCQICKQKGGFLQVDHIRSWKSHIELRFDSANCRTLCVKCHYKVTFGRPMPPEIKTWGHNLKQICDIQYLR